MFIVDDDRKFIVNVDNITQIKLAGTEIYAYSAGAQSIPYILGRYKTSERAEESFLDLLEKAFSQFRTYDEMESNKGNASKREFAEATQAAAVLSMTATYYMPKE